MLVVLIAVVRAVCRRFDLAAILAATLAGATTAIYLTAEGVLAWPVVQTDVTPETVRSVLDPGVARALVLSRDGLHAPASVLLGASVLLIGWLLLRSELRGRWFIAVALARAVRRLPLLARRTRQPGSKRVITGEFAVTTSSRAVYA